MDHGGRESRPETQTQTKRSTSLHVRVQWENEDDQTFVGSLSTE